MSTPLPASSVSGCSATLFANPWLSLRVVRAPELGINGYVYSHETRCGGRIVAVLGYRYDQAGALRYLVRRECTPCWSLQRELSALTGGWEGGNPADDAVRELFEEAGYAVSRDQLVALGESYASKSSDTVYSLYAVELSGFKQPPEPPCGDGSRLEAEGGVEWLNAYQIASVRDPQVAVMYVRLRAWLDEEPTDA